VLDKGWSAALCRSAHASHIEVILPGAGIMGCHAAFFEMALDRRTGGPPLRRYNARVTGHWRSWLARLVDIEEVTGSSPAWPIHNILSKRRLMVFRLYPIFVSDSSYPIPVSFGRRVALDTRLVDANGVFLFATS
jgi:hypothetical protein